MYIQQQPIILASKSPRRQELLKLMGLDFEVKLKEVDETYPSGLTPAEIATYLSALKANAFGEVKDKIVITADTIVALNNEILGKPKDKQDAIAMLSKLAGTKHEVYTGVSVFKDGQLTTFYDTTEVICREANSREIEFYIENYQPFDKAGSYGIQDWWGITVVEKIIGSYTNVMGLPTERLYKVLNEL